MSFYHKLLFIGAINAQNSPLGGEEYKNQLILSKLKSETIELIYFDTIKWKKSPMLVLRMFWKIFFTRYDSLVISASSVSVYRLLTIIHFIRPCVLRKIVYVVIGGYFPNGIEEGRFKSDVYNVLKGLVVEGEFLKNQLMLFIKPNLISVVPNFKDFPFIEFVKREKSKSIKFVFVGRISAAKGVGKIIEASKMVIALNPSMEIQTDFYGPEDEVFNFTGGCSYQGYLDFNKKPEEAYRKLNSYDCMLFPTTWMGEGFPGVIIDAYIAGLAVIGTDWNMNTEIIKDNVNGLIIPPNNVTALANSMLWVINNIDSVHEMGSNNQKIAKNYHIDYIWDRLYTTIK